MAKRPAEVPSSGSAGSAKAKATPRYLRFDETESKISKESLVCWGISMLVAVESLSI